MTKVLITIICITISAFLCADENKSLITKEKENAIILFVNYFFNEDEDGLNKVTSSTLNEDLKKYFWVKKTIQDERKTIITKALPWKGKIEIISAKREKVLDESHGEIMETEEDVFKVRINENIFSLILLKDLSVNGFCSVNKTEKAKSESSK